MICFKRINLKKSFLAWKLYRSFLIKFYRSTALLLRLLELLFAIKRALDYLVTNVIEIEGLLFPGFGQTQALNERTGSSHQVTS